MNKRKNNPMQDSELDRLGDILNGFHSERAMNLEALDGFFAALHCTPSSVPPSRYIPQLWGGGEMADDDAFESEAASQKFFALVMAFWNDVGAGFNKRNSFTPYCSKTRKPTPRTATTGPPASCAAPGTTAPTGWR